MGDHFANDFPLGWRNPLAQCFRHGRITIIQETTTDSDPFIWRAMKVPFPGPTNSPLKGHKGKSNEENPGTILGRGLQDMPWIADFSRHAHPSE
jgi:hypothetical protein